MFDVLSSPLRRLLGVDQMQKEIDSIMANLSEFKLILDRIDTATNQIAAELAALKTQIAGGGLDATAEAAVLASLDAAVKRLEGVGKEVIPPTA